MTIDQLVGGARSIKCMLWETSLLDPVEGIRFRGYSIPELQEKLPTATGKADEEPTPEGLFWLLMTGEVPTKAQADALTAELHERSALPPHVETMSANAAAAAAPHALAKRATSSRCAASSAPPAPWPPPASSRHRLARLRPPYQ